MALGMPQTQREQGMVAIAILGIVAAAGYWYMAYAPKSTELAARSAYVDTLEEKNSLAKVQSSGSSTSEMKAQIEEYGANLQLMRQLVPTSNEVPALIDQVSTAARRAGLDIGKVEPLGSETSTQFQFDALRYKFTITGPYHDVATFLTNVGSLPRIMVPLNIQMQAGAQPGPRIDPKKAVTTVFELHTYVARAAQ
jgi:type IV pilus assembly protein PilO